MGWVPEAGSDADAIHDNVAGEISALTLVTAASGDHILIEDASDSDNKKRVAASDFIGAGGPEGVLGYATATADQTGIQTETDLTSLSVTVTVDTGRIIRVTGSAIMQKISNAGWMIGYIKESTTYLGRWVMETRAVNGYARGEASVILDSPSNGSHTYKLSLEAQNNTANILANAAYPAFILVEDIGAS